MSILISFWGPTWTQNQSKTCQISRPKNVSDPEGQNGRPKGSQLSLAIPSRRPNGSLGGKGGTINILIDYCLSNTPWAKGPANYIFFVCLTQITDFKPRNPVLERSRHVECESEVKIYQILQPGPKKQFYRSDLLTLFFVCGQSLSWGHFFNRSLGLRKLCAFA